MISRRRESGERFRTRVERPVSARWWQRLPGWLTVVAAVVGILGGSVVVFDAAISVAHWADRSFDWRDNEYETLTSLKAGFDLRYFEERLGRPIFTRHSPKGGYVESTFEGRDFWAQTISHQGAVEIYAVTSCDQDFTPTFLIPDESGGRPVTLRRDTLADLTTEGAAYEYLLGANVYRFMEGIYGALPGHYKSYAWGTLTTCGGSPGMFRYFDASLFDRSNVRGAVAELPGQIEGFRRHATINTFVESSPFTPMLRVTPHRKTPYLLNLGEFHSFPIGPSAVLWRSVSPRSFPDLEAQQAG